MAEIHGQTHFWQKTFLSVAVMASLLQCLGFLTTHWSEEVLDSSTYEIMLSIMLKRSRDILMNKTVLDIGLWDRWIHDRCRYPDPQTPCKNFHLIKLVRKPQPSEV